MPDRQQQHPGGLRQAWHIFRVIRQPRVIIIVLPVIIFFWLLFSEQDAGLSYEDYADSIPADLDALTLERFDDLVNRRKIYYEASESELYNDDGFEFDFRVVDMLKNKPILAPEAPGRKTAGGPFISPDPEEILVDFGPSHRLMVNKYCLYRPMLVLPTTEFELQSDDLNHADLAAAWAFLNAYKQTKMVLIYNHGVNSGSSQGHKHLQLFPYPDKQILWPSKASDPLSGVVSDIPAVPFKHFVQALPSTTTLASLVEIHAELLALTKTALAECANGISNDYNIAMTTEWITLVPRMTAGPKGPWGTNAAGILGMVSVRDKDERETWRQLGYKKYLAWLGIPREGQWTPETPYTVDAATEKITVP